MQVAKKGDMVKVHYTGRLDDGTIFDSSQGSDPLEFELGGGQIIPGFEEAVLGMKIDEIKSISIPSDEAYGNPLDELIHTVPRTQFPPDLEPHIGQKFQINQPDGEPLVVTVVAVTEEGITLDANHPLAGENLNFEIQLVEISNSPEEKKIILL